MLSRFVSLRLVYRFSLYTIAFVLAGAVLWTIQQIAALDVQQRHSSNMVSTRQGFYQATATAMAIDDDDARLQGESPIVLMQEIFSTSTPDPSLPSPMPIPTEIDITPEPIDLPKLVLPLDPAPGLILSGTAVPTRVPAIPREYKLVNIILLGGDDELTEDSFIRTDTMIVVSLNTETGTVSMVSLPRDLFVYIPKGTMGRLNTAFGIGENVGWDPDRGFGLLRQTIFYNFGINVHYYARVNFSGFQSIIDKLGGVEIAVDCAYRDWYPVENFKEGAPVESNYYWRTLPVGYYEFDGFDALWYARTRKYTDDLDRGRRQQQLLRAMWRKARSNGLLTTIPTLWNELIDVVDTNLQFEVMLSLLTYVLDLDLDSIQNLTFRRNYHSKNWTTPTRDSVLLPQPEPIAELLRDFYTPPTSNQLVLAGPSVAVYNASGHDNWDLIASERLRWDGYNAVAMGSADDGASVASSQLVDYAALSKGSIVHSLTKALNMSLKQVQTKAEPARKFDYEVILGQDYESCTYGVLPIDD